MKKFAFSLEKIQTLREFKKKQAELDLGKAVQKETEIQHSLDEIARSRVQAAANYDQMKDIGSLYNAQMYLQLLDQKAEKLLEELTQAKIVSAEKRQILEQCIKDCKVLENYKEGKIAEWKKDMLLEEENAIDDIVTSRYNR